MLNKIKRPQASIRTQADIVFCIDSTGSMAPCFTNVIKELSTFVDSLMTSAQVDYRLRLIGYRDHHDPKASREPWEITEFTADTEVFKAQLSRVVAAGGGDAPESTLDALYLALHSKWRPSGTHKAIVLMTDADTHPTISSAVYTRRDNDVHRIIQDFQELRHVMLQIVAPGYPIYQQIEKAGIDALRQTYAHWVPIGDERYVGLSAVNFAELLADIGEAVSLTSIAAREAP